MQQGNNGVFHRLESADREERQSQKWEEVQKLLRLAAENSNEFKARLDKSGLEYQDIRTPEDFSRIPVLRKKDIIRLQEENGLEWMLAVPMGKLRRVYQSPGPIFDPEGGENDFWGWAEAFYACGFRPRDVVQITFGYHLTPAGLMLEEPLREIGCCCIPAGPGNTEKQIELLTSLPVNGFVGMASYLKVIGEKAAASGWDLHKDFQLKTAFVAAERLTDALRREVQDLFNIRVRQGYGTADSGCIAYECPDLGGMHLSSRCWVEICDPETGHPLEDGETGEVVVTPFNPAYPLIRLGTGDLSAIDSGVCACGRTSRKLKGILGRVDDTAKVKGQFVYPSQVQAVLDNFPRIENWQLEISNPNGRDALLLRIKTEKEINREEVLAAFQKTIKLRPQIEIHSAENDLPQNAPQLVDKRRYD